MIHVFFVPGMFGTTVEYLLRNYSKQYSKTHGEILPDGSMHSFTKEFHPLSVKNLSTDHLADDSITTPFYPLMDGSLSDILSNYTINPQDKCVLIHANDLAGVELNCLFQYFKIACNQNKEFWLEIFFNDSDNIRQWNPAYSSWKDMQPWQLREWFSMSYPITTQDWINSVNCVSKNWKILTNTSFLTDTTNTFREILKFCNLTEDDHLDEFAIRWRKAQQYIVDHYQLLDDIVVSTLNQEQFVWSSTNIISESIVQQRLRSQGYEIMCNGLNTFPTSSENLYKLLIKV